MKPLFPLVLILLLLFNCKSETQEVPVEIADLQDSYKRFTDEVEENAVIYEVNVRQYSPQGTFDAFTQDIPVLKELGVKIIWVMPINKISEAKRKAKGDLFTSEIEDESERKKYLGSYYSVSDYRSINPEFGTLADFKEMVDAAHANGIYVIVDWVPNHTGWDHPWITEHPEYYTQNEKGEIIDPINPETGESWGWTDTADLNYDNQEMRNAMIEDLKYWINEADIDGYRMDVAHKVPVDFFERVTSELQEIKPDLFMLAEAEQPGLLKKAFDMQYAWEGHHVLNELSKGSKTLDAFDEYMEKMESSLGDDDINMNFVTNHDENSWSGTLKERMPKNKELFTALTYTMPGMPLIYSGQEYDLEKRLKFFEKDSIPKERGDYFNLLSKLGELKNSNMALHGGKHAASYERLLIDNPEVLMFRRNKEDDEVVFIGNFSAEEQNVTLKLDQSYQDYLTDSEFKSDMSTLLLNPWSFKILVKQE